jgi:alpha-D-ribose 1-methylphosphonate 5-triphosphate diphosphatase
MRSTTTHRQQLAHARVVLADRVLDDANVVLEGDRVLAVEAEAGAAAVVTDLCGHWLLPGLVDLHCDALEKELEPRPGVFFGEGFAVANADKRNAAAGITTVHHAISFADDELGVRNVRLAAGLALALRRFHAHALVDNRVHARYEITDPAGELVLRELLSAGIVDLLSFMDHSPGQGQFRTPEAYRDYVMRTYHRSAAEVERMADAKRGQREPARDRTLTLAGLARAAGVRLASHDDDSPGRVAAMAAMGASISEFPVNVEAATAARAAGLVTVFGAPNILRGSSQSGNVRALDAVHQGLADCLCADYAPAAMLAAAFRLPAVSALSLPEAVRMVTRAPALAAGLEDRGQIAPGLRADLIAVREVDRLPQVTHVWRAGTLVYRAGYPA